MYRLTKEEAVKRNGPGRKATPMATRANQHPGTSINYNGTDPNHPLPDEKGFVASGLGRDQRPRNTDRVEETQ
jgi:hypothetical protein